MSFPDYKIVNVGSDWYHGGVGHPYQSMLSVQVTVGTTAKTLEELVADAGEAMPEDKVYGLWISPEGDIRGTFSDTSSVGMSATGTIGIKMSDNVFLDRQPQLIENMLLAASEDVLVNLELLG